jgi:hypothetical protein
MNYLNPREKEILKDLILKGKDNKLLGSWRASRLLKKLELEN